MRKWIHIIVVVLSLVFLSGLLTPLSAQYTGLLQKNELADGLRTTQILDTVSSVKQNLRDYSFTIRPIMPEVWEKPTKNWIKLT